MAKANAVTGTTIYIEVGAQVPDDLPEGVRLVGPGAPEVDTQGGGEQSSPGTSSSASTSRTQKSDDSSATSHPGRARTTGRRSSKSADSGSAPSTGTSGPETDASDN